MTQSKGSIASFESAINNMTEYLNNLTDAKPLHEVEGKLLVLAFASRWARSLTTFRVLVLATSARSS